MGHLGQGIRFYLLKKALVLLALLYLAQHLSWLPFYSQGFIYIWIYVQYILIGIYVPYILKEVVYSSPTASPAQVSFQSFFLL